MAEKFGFFFVRFNALFESILRVVCHILLLFCLKKSRQKVWQFGNVGVLLHSLSGTKPRGARSKRKLHKRRRQEKKSTVPSIYNLNTERDARYIQEVNPSVSSCRMPGRSVSSRAVPDHTV